MKKININESIWLGVLIAFSYFIFNLLRTGDIKYYIHPRMTIYVAFALVVFVLLALVQTRRILSKHKSKFKFGIFIFILPLVLGFAVEPQAISSDIVAKKGVDIVKTLKPQEVKEDPYKDYREEMENESKRYEVLDYRKADVIETTEENFLVLLDDISQNLDHYKGKKIITYGFVYRTEGQEPDKFLTARIAMVCCAADSLITGFVSQWDQAVSLEEEAWVKIEGIISATEYEMDTVDYAYEVPLIEVTNVQPIDPPEFEYLFPTY